MNKEEIKEQKRKMKLEKQALRLKKLEEKGVKGAKGFIADFKAFIMKGNVIDMAVGVVVASAFTKIVNSLVKDIITPAISILTGKVDFTNLFVALDGNKYTTLEEAEKLGVSTINYGVFITAIIDFLMVALCLFVFLKIMFKVQNIRKKEETKDPTTKQCPYCLSEINIKATKCAHCTSDLTES